MNLPDFSSAFDFAAEVTSKILGEQMTFYKPPAPQDYDPFTDPIPTNLSEGETVTAYGVRILAEEGQYAGVSIGEEVFSVMAEPFRANGDMFPQYIDSEGRYHPIETVQKVTTAGPDAKLYIVKVRGQ